MGITAQDINKLRQLSGAGMMDCKHALTETNGDIDKAIELLRKKGQKIAASRIDRKINEGITVTAVSPEATYGVIIALSSETDFVAKNDNFKEIAQQILTIALAKLPPTLEDLKQLSIDELTIEEKITALAAKTGENIRLTAYEFLEGDTISSYVHGDHKLGVLVSLQGPRSESSQTVGKDIAIQIAALNPIAIDKEDVPPMLVVKELEIAREQLKMEAKNPDMLENIAQGKLNKYFKENTLLNQPFVKDNTITVAQHLATASPTIKVMGFKRIVVGG